MSSWLWSVGATLVALGVAANLLGWDALLWIPAAVVQAVRTDPATYGVIVLGVPLMAAARLMGRRGG
jgi:hypothetical protein